MRDRLIELLKGASKKKSEIFAAETEKWLQKGEIPKHTQTIDEIQADYLLSNGVIVPPCELGTRVYIVLDRYDARKIGCNCCLADYGFKTECAYYKDGDCTNMTANQNWQIISRRFEYQHIDKIGKTVFLTREEAEKALVATDTEK